MSLNAHLHDGWGAHNSLGNCGDSCNEQSRRCSLGAAEAKPDTARAADGERGLTPGTRRGDYSISIAFSKSGSTEASAESVRA